MTVAIECLALIHALLADELDLAATLAGYTHSAYKKSGFMRGFSEQTTHDRLSALLQARLDSTTLDRLSTQGAALHPTRPSPSLSQRQHRRLCNRVGFQLIGNHR